MDKKPYNSLDAYYKKIFGKKTAKLAIDAGFTCPNRDGSISFGGCIFCSDKGSGDFIPQKENIGEQIQEGMALVRKKWKDPAFVAYFQAYTNTYAPVAVLAQRYQEAIDTGVDGIAIATRPDCLGADVLTLLEELNQNIPLWVELGFQTANESTARQINRGYGNSVFEKAVSDLADRGIPIVAHVILGLPGETLEDMERTIAYLNGLPIQGVKLHLLYVVEGTPLAKSFERGEFSVLEREAYIGILCRLLCALRPDIVIHRLTGDGDRNHLIAPLWSLEKRQVLNELHKTMAEKKLTQGQCWYKL